MLSLNHNIYGYDFCGSAFGVGFLHRSAFKSSVRLKLHNLGDLLWVYAEDANICICGTKRVAFCKYEFTDESQPHATWQLMQNQFKRTYQARVDITSGAFAFIGPLATTPPRFLGVCLNIPSRSPWAAV